MISFYQKSPRDVLESFSVTLEQGLSSKEVNKRQLEYGLNQIAEQKNKTSWKIFKNQILNPMNFFLIVVIVVSVFLNLYSDSLIILAIVFVNTTMGFVQENQSERALQSLKNLTAPTVKVWRDGLLQTLDAVELVQGDVLNFEAGDRIPSDVRLVEAHSLKIDESILTGESIASDKQVEALLAENIYLGEQTNMAFAGTFVVKGRGVGVCVRTGAATEFGEIVGLSTHQQKVDLPLEIKLKQLVKLFSILAGVLCVVIVAVGVSFGGRWLDMLVIAMSLAVAAIPEGLPTVITVSLSLGALRLAKKGAIIRKLSAVEALGAITTVCVDKTGTLTQNKMQVQCVYPAKPVAAAFWQTLSLCHDVVLSPDQILQGDPMEVALVQYAQKNSDFLTIQKTFTRISEEPFDAVRKMMSVVCENLATQQKWVFVKGAIETVLRASTEQVVKGEVVLLSAVEKAQWQEQHDRMAQQGLRILAVAYKQFDEKLLESNLVLLGLVGLEDPPRPHVREAIAHARHAGIRPLMMTGDGQLTAQAIGAKLGLLTDEICFRVSPAEKLNIVKDLIAKGHVVAMTGDGVNDVPALNAAHVGIAMGKGTDAAKAAASIVLVDENFSTIVTAIREGRRIYDNMRKFIRYMLATNLGEVFTILFALALSLPMPFLPVQILWINLVSDGLPAVALGYEPAEQHVMTRPPRDANETFLEHGLGWSALVMGLIMAGATVFIYYAFLKSHSLNYARTMGFTSLVFMQMGHVLAVRSETEFLWGKRFWGNWRLLLAVLLTILLQMGLTSFSWCHKIFHTETLSFAHIFLAFAVSLGVCFIVEMEKILRKSI